MATCFTVVLPDPHMARGKDASFSFHAHSPETFAQQLERALRDATWFESWRNTLPDPKVIQGHLLPCDPLARVSGHFDEPRIILNIQTSLSSKVLIYRMALLAGTHWELHDVRPAKP